MDRGSGKTTKQMLQAPINSVFIWVNHHLEYPIHLAKSLNREDIKIVSPRWLSQGKWRGIEIYGLIVDHAAHLTSEQWESYDRAKARMEVRK